MPEQDPNTLADLRDTHVIWAFCDPCGRAARLNTARLTAVYGAEFSTDELKHRLTCRNCGARPRQIRITYAVPARG